MNDAPRLACERAGHITPLLPAAPERDRRKPVAIVRLADRDEVVAAANAVRRDGRVDLARPVNPERVAAIVLDAIGYGALLAVAKAARDVLEAHDGADGEMDWTDPAVDTLLRAALANLEGGA